MPGKEIRQKKDQKRGSPDGLLFLRQSCHLRPLCGTLLEVNFQEKTGGKGRQNGVQDEDF